MSIWDRSRLRHSVGIETGGQWFTSLIPKGTRLPFSLTETFTTEDPNQTSIKIKALQGEDSLASFNKLLGLFEVTEIPPAGPREPMIRVTFHVNAEGALRITARDGTGVDLPVLRR